jgi:hypothetical protein
LLTTSARPAVGLHHFDLDAISRADRVRGGQQWAHPRRGNSPRSGSITSARADQEAADMTADNALRGLACLPTYVQRESGLVCTTCGAVVGSNNGDQIRHTTWHSMLASLLSPSEPTSAEVPPD